MTRKLHIADDTGAGVEFDDLHGCMCRYPVTDDLPHRFCGARQMPGFSYCNKHYAVCYTSVPMRRKIVPDPMRTAA